MAKRAKASAVTSLDVLAVTGSVGYWPGGRALSASPNKADWAAMLQGAHPCYRFLALVYFDAVPQTPEELLLMYRQCLFGACSYLEGHAMTVIRRREDHREAVAKLLEAYAASNPVEDDGTAQHVRDQFRFRIKAATGLIQTIREHIAKHGEKEPPSVTPDSSAITIPSPPNAPSNETPGAKPDAQPAKPSREPTASTPWAVVAVLVVTAIGLLWMFLKRRS